MDLRTPNTGRPLRILSLCSGYGGLDLALGLATRATRTVCYVEREAYPAALLVARMAQEALDRAPVWSDLKSFDGKPWRGAVDCIIGGYPCQPFSIAGRQRGADDPRHLWPDIARIIADVRPALCFFENVRQHVNLGLREVLTDLDELGYRVEDDEGQPLCGIFSAEEVGASHRRERIFILAHTSRERLSDPQQRGEPGASKPRQQPGSAVAELRGTSLGNSTLGGRRDESIANRGDDREQWGGEGQDRGSGGGMESAGIFPPTPGDTERWRIVLTERPDLIPAVAHPYLKRSSSGLDGEPDQEYPHDAAITPDWLPEAAAQSDVRGMADGLAGGVVGRGEQLRAGGNGVVPLQAAYAFSVLARRAGLGGLLIDG